MARKLAYSGFGNDLCTASRSLSNLEFNNYLIGWHQSLWDFLRSNPAQTMHSCHAALANSFPINFPDPAIVKLYTQPLVSSIDGIQQLDLTCSVPDFKAIIHQCEVRLEWGSAQDLLQKFEKDILPAVLLHILINSKGTQNWPNP